MSDAPTRIGKYEILAVLGEGGMGVVYQGRDPLIDRAVAIKTIRLQGGEASESDLVQRLTMEARSAGRLHHPNIVTIYEFGHQEELAYLVMEYVQGRNLATIIRAKSPIALADKVDVMIQICHGMAYAHEMGVAHRDIKPANICLTTRGTPKILDFGLARFDETRLTKTGFVTGTVGYMSPERLRGKTGPADDIFALGALAYELFTYERAFPGKTYKEIATRIMGEDPIPVAEVAGLPSSLDPILRKAMARDPAARYRTADELAHQLDDFKHSSELADFARDEKNRQSLESLDLVIQEPVPGAHVYSSPEMDREDSASSGEMTEIEEAVATEVKHRTLHDPGVDDEATAITETTHIDDIQRTVPGRGAIGKVDEHATTRVEAPDASEPTRLDRQKPDLEAPADKSELRTGRTRWGKPVEAGGARTPPDQGAPTEGFEAPISGPTQLVSSLKSLPHRAKTLFTRTFGPASQGSTTKRVSAADAGMVTDRTAVRRWSRSEGVAAPAPIIKKETPRDEGVAPVVAGIGRMEIASAAILAISIVGAPLAFGFGGIPAYLVFFAVAGGSWIWLMRSVENPSLKIVLATAILLRTLVLFHDPGLSNDVYRYAWDGQVSAAKSNPYAVPPSDPSLEPLRDATFAKIDQPEIVSPYPAWAEILFWLWASAGGGLLLWRAILLIVDVVTVWLLWDERSPRRSLAYATFPLAILEGIWNGHVEIVTGALLVVTCISLRRNHEGTASFAVGLATGTTIFAGAAIFAALEGAGRFLKMLIALGGTLLLGALFFGFRGSFVTPMRVLGEESPQLRFLTGALEQRFEATTAVDSIRSAWSSVAGKDLPPLLENLTAGALAGIVITILLFVLAALIARWTFTFERSMVGAVGVIVACFLFVRPWYWLTIAPAAILASQPLWILVALFSPVLYLLGVKSGAGWLVYGIAYGIPVLITIARRGRNSGEAPPRSALDFRPTKK